MRRALAAVLVLAATAPVAAASAPEGPPAVVRRYLAALHTQRYADAYALLDPAERAYFRSAANFASGFAADGYALATYRVRDVRAAGRLHVVIVRERIALDDPAHDVRVTTTVDVPYVVERRGATFDLADPGRPWRAFAAAATGTAQQLRVTVRKVALYARTIRVVLTMQNDGAGFVTVLPYGRSVLRDDTGAIYRPIETDDWQITDRQFFLGVRLAPNSRYTGAIAFLTPPLDDRARRFSLTLGPTVRDGGTLPFSVDVPGIAPRT
jgi:hypothetical protein